MISRRGIVEYFGSNLASDQCGYCKGQKPGGVDSSMWAHFLTAQNYQTLIDRGWRRSGKYCYKPDVMKSCCPPYTIKCDVLNFKLTKSQKKVLKNMHNFLVYGESKNMAKALQSAESSKQPIEKNECSANSVNKKCAFVTNVAQVNSENPNCFKGIKAKQKRLEKSLSKVMKSENCDRETALNLLKRRRETRNRNLKEKSLDDRINHPLSATAVHKLDIRYVCTVTDEYKDTFNITHEVYQKYQMKIHKDTSDKCNKNQMRHFLVDSPFELEPFELSLGDLASSLPIGYGSFHMQYFLDDELIAVGVIDVLSNCVSSVYFFYDPKYEFLSLGTYSALREIHLTKQLNSLLPNIQQYYMGFYIHSCPKMRYKGKFYPSHLLCPETFTWINIQNCIPLLEKNERSRLQPDSKTIDEESVGISDEDILILFKNNAMSFSTYKVINSNHDEREVYEYAKLLGRICVRQILLYRPHNN